LELDALKRNLLILIILIMFAVPLFHVSVLEATPGTLDTSFGTNGITTTPLSSGAYSVSASAMVLQSDGKIVVVGTVRHNANPYISYWVLARYKTDGSLDSNFGGNGNGTINTKIGYYAYYNGPISQANGIAVQPDGKIVVVGYAYVNGSYRIAVARYLPSGTPDASFGPYSNGSLVVQSPGGSYAFAYAVAVQPSDNKILLVGQAYVSGSYEYALVRLTTSGAPDSGFGTNGFVTTLIGYSSYPGGNVYDSATELAVQPNGNIVVAGSVSLGYSGGLGMARYTTGGILDSSFGDNGNGTITTQLAGFNSYGASSYITVSGIAYQPDGKLIIAGTAQYYAGNGYFTGPILFRFKTDGTLDPTFGVNGIAASNFGSNVASGLVIQSDGKFVLAGSAKVGVSVQIALTRFTSNGTIDTGFGQGGMQMVPSGATTILPVGMANMTDGRIVVAGTSASGYSTGFAVARFIMSDTSAPFWISGSSLAATNVGQTGLTLVWTSASDDAQVTSYKIYQGTTLLSTVSASTHSFNVTGLTAGTSYTFKVEAGDSANNYSTTGPSLTVTTTSPSSSLGGLLPWLILVAVVVGFGAAFFLTKPKLTKTT
jgi:uncharacterized delta-60 repeat protein